MRHLVRRLSILALLLAFGAVTPHASTKLSNAAVSAAVDAVTAQVDGGTLVMYTGSAPATVDDAPTGTVVASLTLSSPAFGAASNGVATANTITSATASNSGTVGYFRLRTSGGSARIQGTVTTAGGGGDLILGTTAITAGETVSVTSLTYTLPKS